MPGATEQECLDLIGRLVLPTHPQIYEWDTDDWAIVVVFSGVAPIEQRVSLDASLPPGWYTRWRDTEYRGESCAIRKLRKDKT